MKTKVLAMLLSLALAQSVTATTSFSGEIARKTTLPNGLTLIVAERPQLPTIHLQVVVRAGAAADPAGREGLANLTAETLLQGTRTQEAQTISRRIEAVGGSLNSGADLDFATVSLAVLKKDLALGLEILADVLLNPLFAAPELARKVDEMKARLQRMDEDPRQVAQLAFAQKIFGSHPYARPVEGTLAGLAAVQRQQVLDFFREFYRPNNAALTLVGQISLEEAQNLVTQALENWKPGPVQRPSPAAPPELSRPQMVKIDRPISQANLIWGHLGIARSNPDFYALQVMNYILGGGGFVSRLMDQIRDNLGLTYSIYSHFNALEYPGSFIISLETKNQNGNRAVAEILKEMRRYLEKGVTETELAEAKAYLTGSFPLRMDTNAKTVRLLSAMEIYGLGLDYPEKYPQWINRISAEEVLRVARKYLHPDRFLLVVVGDQGEIGLEDISEIRGQKSEVR
ncbi:MAG: insulinase family protein [Desulfobacterota bacterium]|nr:insulinase family protein [Thermodesulfobacteriota bacterium]